MAKTVRSAVSIPIELKAKMDAVEESVNWSALACKAFEDKVAEIAKRKAEMDRADVITRLRASKRQVGDSLFNSGFAAGEKWAKSEANAWELMNLDKFRSEVTCEGRWDLEDYYNGELGEQTEDLGFAKGLAGHALGMNRDDWDDAITDPKAHEMFDNQIYAMKEPMYVYGFAKGALSVWDQVKNEL